MIRVETISYRYPRADAWVFRNHAFMIDRGQIFAILGPNGRGKTTLLKCMAGLIAPATGRVTMDGTLGYVPQAFATPFAYTVRDVVLMGRARQVGLFGAPGRADRAEADKALSDLGIAHFATRRITSLSGGERQMVLIARALASGAEVIVLDEPTSALDFRNQAIVLSTLHRLARERALTMVMTTHHPQHALEIADAALLMYDADTYAVGSAAEMLTEARLSDLYHVPIRHAAVTHEGRKARTMVPILS